MDNIMSMMDIARANGIRVVVNNAVVTYQQIEDYMGQAAVDLNRQYAGEPATLFVLPALYSLLIRDKKPGDSPSAIAGAPAHA